LISRPVSEANENAAEVLQQLRERILMALARGESLSICGQGSKAFYGRRTLIATRSLSTLALDGVVDYEPTELVITARAATPLAELERVLAQHGQMLPCEPPRFAGRGTLGGALATGLSGPRRPYAGALRDFVLGVQLIDGRGQVLRFGGRVIKNVAGFDASRLMAGAMGTLGLVTEVTLKIQPLPPHSATLVLEMDAPTALARISRWRSQPLPISGTCHHEDRLYVRLCGAESAVRESRRVIGGALLPDAARFWRALRDHTHAFFQSSSVLWRVSVPATTPALPLPQPQLIEWGGAQRWVYGDVDAQALRERLQPLGGHLTCFRGHSQGSPAEPLHPLPTALHALQQRVKYVFDPTRLFNPGRLYAGI
jgi:glycolate oxidase FAD binding subunit